MKTFQFVHFSTFYSILNLFDQIDIDLYRLLIFFLNKNGKTVEQVRALNSSNERNRFFCQNETKNSSEMD